MSLIHCRYTSKNSNVVKYALIKRTKIGFKKTKTNRRIAECHEQTPTEFSRINVTAVQLFSCYFDFAFYQPELHMIRSCSQ